jgi:hypothetical protein
MAIFPGSRIVAQQLQESNVVNMKIFPNVSQTCDTAAQVLVRHNFLLVNMISFPTLQKVARTLRGQVETIFHGSCSTFFFFFFSLSSRIPNEEEGGGGLSDVTHSRLGIEFEKKAHFDVLE